MKKKEKTRNILELLNILLKETKEKKGKDYNGLCAIINWSNTFNEKEKSKLIMYIYKNRPDRWEILRISNIFWNIFNDCNAYFYHRGKFTPRINFVKHLIKKENAKQRRN